MKYASIIKYELTETSYKAFPGILRSFAININVYELREEGVAELKKRSGKKV